jgi:hypothetical protein
MNKLKKYEQLIADKFQQLPVPDTENSWQQMKQLLDDEQPPRRSAWKWTAILAVVITIGLWWLAEANKTNKNQPLAAKQTNNVIKQSINSAYEDTATLKIVTAKNKIEIATTNKVNTQENPVVAGEAAAKNLAGNNAAVKNTIVNDGKAPVTAKKNSDSQQITSPTVSAVNNSITNTIVIESSIRKTNRSTTGFIKNKKQSFPFINNRPSNVKQDFASLPERKNDKTISKNTGKDAINTKTPQTKIADNDFSEIEFKQKQSQLLANWSNGDLIVQPAVLNIPSPANTMLIVKKNWQQLDAQLAQTAYIQKQKLLQQKEQEKMVKKIERRDRLHNGLGNMFKPFSLKAEGEPWWAVGLALNNSVTTGSQAKYNYNVNAKNNVALDFLPSPYIQYHINSNVYLQTELNLSAPQHTPQILVSKNNLLLAGNNIQKSIFVQKLYYFNWPVSLHYSPVNNLYLGAGLQFSSLQSGLSLTQERNTVTNELLRSSVLKFKDDSTAARFKTNEWRWQTGADYYWNRFTLGLRYNQSFTKLLNKQAVTTPNFNNNSFLLFVKYNLFEGRKKETGNYKSTARY